MSEMKYAPWDDPYAANWLGAFQPWQRMLRMVKKTLEQEPRNYPHQIRAAASFVILFCRPGMWPDNGSHAELDVVIELTRRQLSTVRQMYALEGRSNKKLMANRNFKALLKSLEEEIRILDSRMSDEDGATKINQAPASWGDFLGKRQARRNEFDP